MKRILSAIILSMMAAILLVNASAQDLPSSNQPAQKAALKDSVKQTSSDLSKLIDLLMKTGEDDELPGTLSPVIGLTGARRVKGRDFILPRFNGKERRECTIVFSDDSKNTVSKDNRPSCLYIQHKIISGHDGESLYYRLSVDGKLEHALVSHSKYDDNGKVIAGSATDSEKDIHSPAVQKAFKEELAYWTKEWLKKEQKELAKAKASAASGKVPAGPAAE